MRSPLPVLAVLLLAPRPDAQAGEPGPDDVPPAASERDVDESWSYDLHVGGRVYFESELDDEPGDVALDRRAFSVGARRRLGPRRTVSLRGHYAESFYAFGGGALLGGFPKPFEDLALASLSATLDTRLSDTWSWRGTVWTTCGWEDGASLSDAVTFGGGATLTFPLTRAIDVTAGGFASTRLEDDPLVYPWIALDWRPTERLHLGREGGGVGLGYDWRDHVRSYVNISFAERQYRLGDAAPVPAGVARDDEVALNVGLVYDLDEHFTAELVGGVAVRRLTLLDDVELDDATTDPGGHVALGLRYRF